MPMGPSFLNDETAPFIFDASTIINLNGTGCAAAILGAIPNRLIVMDAVVDELGIDNRSSRDDEKLLASLIAGGLVSKIAMGALKGDHFEHLVLGNTADTLDDGEAATIACAIEMRAVAVIDERKAKRICRARYPRLVVASTVNILALDSVAKALGDERLPEAVYGALSAARMRVLPEHIDWVVNLIGAERAVLCTSLPGHVRDAARRKTDKT
jgi:predicted nucleic acid-binding protein